MILQCEQCSTRFRLDDSKLKPGGVKVRCSKCRHVFIAGAEQPQEETDFDAILSGLGAPAAKPAEPAPAPQEPAPPELPVPEEKEEGDAAKGAAEPADFAFGLPPEKEEEPEGAGRFAGVSEFSFEPEPAGEPSATTDFAPSDFSFDLEPSAKGEEPPPTEEMAGFNEFSFDDEPSAKELEPPPSGMEVVGFQEFSFEEEVTAPAPPALEAEKSPAREFDFGEFSLEEEPAAEPAPKQGVTPVGSDFDFGDFSFDAEEEGEKPVPEFDLSDFTFEGDADQAARELAQSGYEEPETGGFAFSGENAAPAPPGVDEFAFAEEKEEAAPELKNAAEESAFSFNDDLLGGAPAPAPVVPAPAATPAAPRHDEEAVASTHPSAEEESASDAAGGPGIPLSSLLDFDKVFGDSATAPHGAAADEELPPLGIPSRRRGRPVVTTSLALLSVLLVAALAGGGYYLMKGGPSALDRLGLGTVAHWLGLEGAEEGRIAIVNPLASFYQNKEAGELFVVSGEAENQFRKPRASIHVRVSIFDKSGKVLVQKTAYCGNRLSEQQLTTLPMAKLDAAMNNQFGDSLANLGVKPGDKIPFVVAIPNVPKEAADFGVEVIGSTVAGQ
ncbi:zinc-ribbon domain-containing protein [Geomonas sp. RF6]|uniref:DUF3426 domain-containing protein n=1 Tax=Geomonas sp. RF6 TaxID=2897342 RepID=UPI001E3D15C7|nr:DUF3426 domain-containing protein [Geomonas sp. RF6]UFS70598.1 zinc-ribbon domain-containing protein [Geomonas sp. RF6]